MRGFTIFELLIIVGILALMAALAVPALHGFQLTSDLDNSAEELINYLRSAQQKTIASEGASSWGIYFSTTTIPHQYTLFKGENYSLRQSGFDEVHKMPGNVLISEINLSGAKEVVFTRVSGISGQSGSVDLALMSDPSKIKTVYIEESGQAGFTAPASPSDFNRIKDSRHVHADYSRYISTTTESIILTFFYDSFTQTETIAVADNMGESQIYWEGEINVGGQLQKLKIHTHKLNDPFSGTQFSIHRDGRYNTRALKIGIDDSPDPDAGNIIEYSADGSNTISTSVYVTGIQWQ